MRLVLATTNAGKAREIASVLSEYGISLEVVAVDVPEARHDDVGVIASAKALDASQIIGRPLIVDDTGLFLEAFPGFPGALSRWVVARIGIDGILRLLEGRSHAAYFRTAVAFVEPGGRPQVFTGTAEGELCREAGPAVEASLPYDPIFRPAEGDGRVYSAMELEEKLALSSRARAAHAFGAWWLSRSARPG